MNYVLKRGCVICQFLHESFPLILFIYISASYLFYKLILESLTHKTFAYSITLKTLSLKDSFQWANKIARARLASVFLSGKAVRQL